MLNIQTALDKVQIIGKSPVAIPSVALETANPNGIFHTNTASIKPNISADIDDTNADFLKTTSKVKIHTAGNRATNVDNERLPFTGV
jgi:hypothetical protein